MDSLRTHTAAAIGLACALLGCGDDGGGPQADAGTDPNVLEILDPPGDAIGLPFADSALLRVRYQRADGSPIRDTRVEFSILAGASETVGGSALSATDATTDGDGIASVELVAGAQVAGFRVAAAVGNSAQATFFVTVSDQGFTRLLVEPVHDGPRADLSFTQIDVRLYRPEELRCPDVDPDLLPASLFPPRSLVGYGEVAEIPNLASGAGYTVLAWATIAPSATPLSFGCVELDPSQTRNFDVKLPLQTTDRPVRMDEALALETDLDLAFVRAAAPDAETPWTTLSCPLGAGQLLVDCIADALLAQDPLDCDFTAATGALADAIRAERGPANQDGCRPGQDGGGGTSVDELLDDAVSTGAGFPTGSSLTDLVAVRDDIASRLTLTSRLRVQGSAASHRLTQALVGPAPGYAFDLESSSRLVIERSAVPTTVAPLGASSPVAEIAAHDFTLDYGSIARDGFQALALDGESLDGSGLGVALVASVSDGGNSGCIAASDVFCTAVGQASGCAVAACSAAESHIDDRLQDWWKHASVGGLDFAMAASIELRDSDDDLIVDRLGRSASDGITGSVSAVFKTTSGDVPAVPGTAASP